MKNTESLVIQDKLFNTMTYPEPEGNATFRLWDIVDRFRRGALVLPPHQRDRSWTDKDDLDWFDTIRTSQKLSVSFITYQLKEGDGWSVVFLNDGGNRARASLRFYENCEAYGLTKEEAEWRLRSISVGVVHWHHLNWQEAVREFTTANKGTNLTPYESNAYELRYLSSFVQEGIVRIHEAMARCEQLVRVRIADSREKIHQYRRADMAMFLRFLDKDVSVLDYDVTGKEKHGQTIEKRLREQFERMSAEDVARNVKLFGKTLDEEAVLIDLLWRKYLEKNKDDPRLGKRPLSRTAFRWCLDVGIIRRHLKLDIEQHMEWCSALFDLADGQGQLHVPGDRITLALEHLTRMWAVSELIGCSEYGKQIQRENKRSRRRGPRQRSGIANSHYEPFATNGNGPTFPEPSVINRARGMRAVSADEARENMIV